MTQVFNNSNFLHRVFSRYVIGDHLCGEKLEDKIENDWEFIEILDCELTDDESSEISEQIDIESLFSHGLAKTVKYTVMSKADLRKRLEDNITKVCEVLLVTRDEAAILLQHFKWAVNETNYEWMTSEEKVRLAVGLFERPVVETPADAAEVTCTVCHANFSRDVMHSVSCGHQICKYCWEGFISETISNGPQCLTLRCPATSCDAAVGPYLMKLLLSEEDRKKFEDHFLGSYLLAINKKVKCCPAPDCDCAVLSSVDQGKVTCQCLQTFCWKCSLEGHTPVDCATANTWMTEGDRRSEDWVYANTTACPNCNYQYERTEFQYFTFSQCTICSHWFCRACGNKWDSTQNRTWSHSCVSSAENEHKELIKKSVERYNRYYEAWAICESSRKNALDDLKLFKEFQQNYNADEFGDFGFVVEVLKQVIECWQFLKWTHVYGYYMLSQDEPAKKNYFEFTQEDATGLVRRLQRCVNAYQDFLYDDVQPLELLQYRIKLIKLTSVIKRYFDHMEDGLIGALSEVVCIPTPNTKLEASQREDSNSLKTETTSLSGSLTHKIMRRIGDINVRHSVSGMQFEDSP